MEKILKFLKENPIFYIATVDGDKPRVRPFGLAFLHNGKLYFTTGRHKEIFRQLRQNPNVEISATTPDGGQWIRIRGKAVFDDAPEVVRMAFEAAPMLKEMYNENTGLELVTFYLADIGAEMASLMGKVTKLA